MLQSCAISACWLLAMTHCMPLRLLLSSCLGLPWHGCGASLLHMAAPLLPSSKVTLPELKRQTLRLADLAVMA
jgi:hypothetical protein